MLADHGAAASFLLLAGFAQVRSGAAIMALSVLLYGVVQVPAFMGFQSSPQVGWLPGQAARQDCWAADLSALASCCCRSCCLFAGMTAVHVSALFGLTPEVAIEHLWGKGIPALGNPLYSVQVASSWILVAAFS